MSKKKILFLTGTRADFGKVKSLIHATENEDNFKCSVFVTGMHMLSRYGLSVEEVRKEGFKEIYTFINQVHGEPMELILANTISGLSRYMHEFSPDLIVVHGDRIETLAGAISGALTNTLVAHIEGGEISGTIDELIRHSVSKLSHLHFVANDLAAKRLRQLGENNNSIYVIGSPDIDIMLSEKLPSLEAVKKHYEINFDNYGVVIFHPVTTEQEKQYGRTKELVEALLETGQNYVVIYPNNDQGSEYIFEAYKALEGNPRFKIFPCMRFEYFLTLIKNSRYIIGNSSAGIREAPVYAVISVNIGNRQRNRFYHETIINADYDKKSILDSIAKIKYMNKSAPCHHFGDGNSVSYFIKAIRSDKLWKTAKQKEFCDLISMNSVSKIKRIS
ncbi:MAG: UDP-N-acetylglucosamine 2-epimerase [Candidatus Omnitrophota bacterium]|jgi:UDP-N-acetylglucosamine 2-epimerase (hydrolysing)